MFDGIENVHPDQRRGLTALVSFTLQAAAVAAALTIPLLYPGKLTDVFNHQRIFIPVTDQQVPITTEHQAGAVGHVGPMLPTRPMIVNQNPGIHFPVPNRANVVEGPPSLDPTLDHNTGPGIRNIMGPALEIKPVLAKAPIISRSMQSYLIRRVEPIYPTIARNVGAQGAVLIKAVISTEGRIEQAQIVSGSPLLSKAALDAIQQWRYRPYYLNDKPVEVETEITVMFTLTR
jgi:periplasmic protein TonB